MGEIVTVSKEFCGFELKYLLFDSEPWFKGKVVANALGYSDTDQALRKHVENDDKKKLGELRAVSRTGSDGEDPNAWKS
jgi:prophage antirepressor-like protein